VKSADEILRTVAKKRETDALKRSLTPEVVAATNQRIAASLRGRKASEEARASHRAAHARGAYKNAERASPIHGTDVTSEQRLERQLAKAEKKLAKLKAEAVLDNP
jgi:hypothetical protein